MKYLVSVGEGLGNVIETLPLIKALKYNKLEFDILNLSHIPTENVEWIFKEYATVIKGEPRVDQYAYRIELATTKFCPKFFNRTKIPLINNLNNQFIYSTITNEIEVYLSILNELNFEDAEMPYDVELPKTEEEEQFDFILMNGCAGRSQLEFKRKKYPHMAELGNLLISKKYKVASIGIGDEYAGGENKTGMSICKTAGYLRSCKFLITNDTGFAHLAAALKINGVILYTATNMIKNYHPVFHKTLKPVTADIPCQPCQYRKTWNLCSPKTYNKWECQNIPFSKILKEIKNADIF